MYLLLVCVVLPWTATAASPRSDEHAASKRKDASKFFGAGRSTKRKDDSERQVRATYEVESDGQTKPVVRWNETPPAIRVEADVPLEKQTPGIPAMTPEDDETVPKIVHFMFKEDLTQPGSQWPNPVLESVLRIVAEAFPTTGIHVPLLDRRCNRSVFQGQLLGALHAVHNVHQRNLQIRFEPILHPQRDGWNLCRLGLRTTCQLLQ